MDKELLTLTAEGSHASVASLGVLLTGLISKQPVGTFVGMDQLGTENITIRLLRESGGKAIVVREWSFTTSLQEGR